MDSNRGPLVLEATALPTEPQPLPLIDSFAQYLLFIFYIILFYILNV